MKLFSQIYHFLEANIWIVLILLSLPSVGALFMPGFFGASDELHIAWLHQIDMAIKSGQIPPRYVPDLSFGFGYPLFNFVFPLPFYIGLLFHWSGFSFVDSIKAVFGLSLIFSALTMYLLLKEFSSRLVSVVGALVYLYTPYRAVDIYIRGAIGEAFAFIFLPLIILSIIKLTSPTTKESSSYHWIGLAALSLAGLILSHNITALMFVPFATLLWLIRFFTISKTNVKILIQSFAAVFLGFLSSIYFWLPALLDSQIMKHDTVFNFVDHYPTLRQLFIHYWGYGGSVPGPGDGMSFFIGAANLIVLSCSGITLFLKWKNLDLNLKTVIIWLISSFMLSVFMMNYRSIFIWQVVPFFDYFQFPWRFLTITTAVVPLGIIVFNYFKYKNLLTVGLLIFVLVTSFTYFRPEHFLDRTDYYYLNRYIPIPAASEEYKLIQEEYLRLPKATLTRPDRNFPSLFSDQSIEITETKRDSLSILAKVVATQETILNYNKYFFPGWQATIDEKYVKIADGQPFGQIQIIVPEGEHTIKIWFQETKRNLLLDAVSLISIILASIFIMFRFSKKD